LWGKISVGGDRWAVDDEGRLCLVPKTDNPVLASLQSFGQKYEYIINNLYTSLYGAADVKKIDDL
jgi:hypothetical protein